MASESCNRAELRLPLVPAEATSLNASIPWGSSRSLPPGSVVADFCLPIVESFLVAGVAKALDRLRSTPHSGEFGYEESATALSSALVKVSTGASVSRRCFRLPEGRKHSKSQFSPGRYFCYGTQSPPDPLKFHVGSRRSFRHAMVSRIPCNRSRRARMTRRPFLIAALLLALALMTFWLDMMLLQVVNGDVIPGEVHAMLNRAEAFGHGYGVIFIILTIWVLTRCKIRELSPLVVCSLGAGLMADVIKMGVGRTRPFALNEDFSGSTFTGIMPWLGSESFQQAFDHANQSFPSAHTATAFGLAVCLAWMFPHGARWFLTLASLVAIQRVATGAHYVSDVIAGAAIGIVVAAFAIRYFESRDSNSADCDDVVTVKTDTQPEFSQAA